MATFRKRGTTRPFSWEAQVRVRGWPAQTKTFPTKADAEQWASEREAEMRRGTFVDTSSLRASTVHDLLARYLRDVTPTKKGWEPETYRLKAMMRSPMAKMTLDRLSPSVVVEWRDARRKVVSADTVRREMNLLSSVFAEARSEWAVPLNNPVKGVRRPKQAEGRSRRPNWSELRRLLRELSPRVKSGVQIGARNPWVLPAAVFALRTAMRRSEILTMRWEHVDLMDRFVHLPDTKNSTSRDVPLSKKAVALLRRLPRGEKSGLVFPATTSAFKQVFARAMERSGVENLRFHDFRHDAATRLASKLSNVLELSAVTGHKSLSMLKRYYNPKASELARKLD
jgi:integrase